VAGLWLNRMCSRMSTFVRSPMDPVLLVHVLSVRMDRAGEFATALVTVKF
jgi:hypothetical protein